jgi:hypothetical protein
MRTKMVIWVLVLGGFVASAVVAVAATGLTSPECTVESVGGGKMVLRCDAGVGKSLAPGTKVTVRKEIEGC